jgi:hypothetical protein
VKINLLSKSELLLFLSISLFGVCVVTCKSKKIWKGKAGCALDWIGTVCRDKTHWKQMDGRALHRPGPAQTPSAGIGTVPEYWTEQNVPKV